MNILTPKNVMIAVVVIILAALAAFGWLKTNNSGAPAENTVPPETVSPAETATTTDKSDLIRVDSLRPGDTVSSPLAISGQARGTWFFEASFPVRMLAADSSELGVAIATAQSDWMTTDFVPFTATLEFSRPASSSGYLVFQKDNPSGLPEHDDELRLPVNFDLSQAATRSIRLYYYDPKKDQDASGNIMCTAAGLVAVNREIPLSATPIQDAVRLLLAGELSAAEKAGGVSTEFPLSGVSLKGAALKNGGELTLEFSDPDNRTGGGSCRVAILWAQIAKTAQQFPEVKIVIFKPDYLFQP